MDEAAGTLSSYERGCVSLPRDKSGPCPLIGNVSEDMAKEVANFRSCLLKSPEEIAALFDDTETFAQSYHDPAFTDMHMWCEFVRELLYCGIIRFS